MKIKQRDILKLLISISLTGYVLVTTSKNLDWNQVKKALLGFEYGWIILSLLLSIVSHALRAYRWTLLLGTKGFKPSVFTTYLAVMTCYLGNMAIPRLGEVARCSIMKNEEDIPISFSLGTVITDRLMDLFMLFLLATFLILMQFDLLQSYFVSFINTKLPFITTWWPIILATIMVGIFAIIYIVKKAKKEASENTIAHKIGKFISEMLTGVKAVKRVSRPIDFWLSTIGIWILYFLMLYVISFGYGPTADLSLMAGIAVLVMGSLGMAAPVNNGIGTYQAFVASILVIYGIPYENGYIFALISHGSQVISVILIGFLSLLILNFRKRKKSLGTKQ